MNLKICFSALDSRPRPASSRAEFWAANRPCRRIHLHSGANRVMNRRAPKRAERIQTRMNETQSALTEKTATLAEQGAQVAPANSPAKKGPTAKKKAPKAPVSAKGGKAKAAPKK